MNHLDNQPISVEQNQLQLTQTKTISQLERMRPTLVILLGGTGQQTGVYLKRLLTRRFADRWQEKIRLIAFDTTEEPVVAQLDGKTIRLEAGSEFFDIGGVPIHSILKNLDQHEAIAARLGQSLKKLPAMIMRSGAKQVRPLGLLALLWHYKTVWQALRRAIWALADRTLADGGQQQGLNVFIGGSLCGGTCSGTIIDIAYLVRALFEELGAQGEFSHITGIGVLPQAFRGVAGPNLYPNTGAALAEINYLTTKGGFEALYPDGRFYQTRQAPFNLFYLIDGVDERGHTWSAISDVTTMMAEGIFLQMASQLGQKGDNAFDNVDEILIGQTEEGDGTFFASFGLGTIHFDAPAAAELCAHWWLRDTIRQGWLQSSQHSQLQLTALAPQGVINQLQYDPESESDLRLTLHLPNWLKQKGATEIVAATTAFLQEYEQSRLNERLIGQIRKNGQLFQQQQIAWLQSSLNKLAQQSGLPTAQAATTQFLEQLRQWQSQTQAELTALTEQIAQQRTAQKQQVQQLMKAASSLPFGRNGRISKALGALFKESRTLFDALLQQATAHALQQLYHGLMMQIGSQQAALQTLSNHLQRLTQWLNAEATQQTQALSSNGVSQISLTDADYLQALYQHYAPAKLSLFDEATPLEMAAWSPEMLQDRLLEQAKRPFAPLAVVTVEQIIAARSAELSPRARRQQLFGVATPSWAINRARLPEGGNGLVRLEVLGVYDETDTLFDEEPTIVSTHDPQRLIALRVVAGAPQSALQQFSRYQRELAQAHKQRPVYILPAFMTNADQTRLAFALGTLFGFISSQGTHFYYYPADTLIGQQRLGQGLVNAVTGLDSDVAKEIMERCDGKIAQMGLAQAIEVLVAYTEEAIPAGRSELDNLTRELKRLVRDYLTELQEINALGGGGRSR